MYDLETLIRLNNEAAEREAKERKASKSEYDEGYFAGYDSAKEELEAFYQVDAMYDDNGWYNQGYDDGWENGCDEGRNRERKEIRKAVVDLIRKLSI